MLNPKVIDQVTLTTGTLMGIQSFLKRDTSESPEVTNKIIKILDECIENLNEAEEELMKDYERKQNTLIDAKDWAKKYHV